MITLDGSCGGGQILRTALGLSALTGKPFTLKNIRAGRPNPGLQEQHVQGVRAMKHFCSATVSGMKKLSTALTFCPTTTFNTTIDVTIATAGSVGLVLQALLIPTFHHNTTITVFGGASVGKWAPPLNHFTHVLIPLWKRMGFDVELQVQRHGFYPRGGAHIKVQTRKASLRPLNIFLRGNIKSYHIHSLAAQQLEKSKVAERQMETAKSLLKTTQPITTTIEYCTASCPGSSLQISAHTEHSILGSDSLGEKGKTAEQVAEEAVTSLQESLQGSVDIHTADMLLPYIAIAGGSYKMPKMTNHIETNISVIEQFLNKKFELNKTVVTMSNE